MIKSIVLQLETHFLENLLVWCLIVYFQSAILELLTDLFAHFIAATAASTQTHYQARL